MVSPAPERRILFRLGQLVATPNSLANVDRSDVERALARHARGDWGDVGTEDRAANDAAVRNGERLLSSYRSSSGVKFWIITEADRSATTVLLPEDY